VLPSIIPAKLARSLEPFDDPAWLFELKHDGFRSLAYIEDGKCRLVSRHRNVYKSFETLRDALAALRVESAILDGEIVCLDENGCSQFKELLYRRGRAVFFAFDMVWLDGEDLRQIAWIERKKKLKNLIKGSDCSEILYAQPVSTTHVAPLSLLWAARTAPPSAQPTYHSGHRGSLGHSSGAWESAMCTIVHYIQKERAMLW
jgi:ATP-dependent DNA ligase